MKTIKITLVLISLSCVAAAQQRAAIQEFEGTFQGFEMGIGYVLSKIRLKVGETTECFAFPENYCQELQQALKVGQSLRVRAMVHRTGRDKPTLHPTIDYFFPETVTDVWLDGRWKTLDHKSPATRALHRKSYAVFLDKKIEKMYWAGGYKVALRFDRDQIAYFLIPSAQRDRMKHLNEGQLVSFMGGAYHFESGMCYPHPEIRGTHSFIELLKAKGVIVSFLFKQNFACIGMRVETEAGLMSLGFPSEYAEIIHSIARRNEQITIYYDALETQITPEPTSLHAIIAGRDTVKIGTLFYGGADGEHQHIPVVASGRINQVLKSEKGRMIGLIIDKKYFVETTAAMVDQLREILSKGKWVVIEGDQRIKKKGEVYSKNYEIVVPRKITVEEKTYLVN